MMPQPGAGIEGQDIVVTEEGLVLRAVIAVTYSPQSTPRSQRLFWKLMDEAPDARRELLDVAVDE